MCPNGRVGSSPTSATSSLTFSHPFFSASLRRPGCPSRIWRARRRWPALECGGRRRFPLVSSFCQAEKGKSQSGGDRRTPNPDPLANIGRGTLRVPASGGSLKVYRTRFRWYEQRRESAHASKGVGSHVRVALWSAAAAVPFSAGLLALLPGHQPRRRP